MIASAFQSCDYANLNQRQEIYTRPNIYITFYILQQVIFYFFTVDTPDFEFISLIGVRNNFDFDESEGFVNFTIQFINPNVVNITTTTNITVTLNTGESTAVESELIK